MADESGTSTIAEINIQAGDFEFGRVLSGPFELELERIIPLSDDRLVPLVWLNKGEPEEFEREVGEHTCIEGITRLAAFDDQVLFQVEWTADIDGFLGPLIHHDVLMLGGDFENGVWDFRLSFSSRETLVEFHEELTANLISVTLDRVYNPGPPVESPPISEERRETVEQAYQLGYFEVPRETTIKELAEREGISDSAYSKRLRRGLQSIIERSLPSAFDAQR